LADLPAATLVILDILGCVLWRRQHIHSPTTNSNIIVIKIKESLNFVVKLNYKEYLQFLNRLYLFMCMFCRSYFVLLYFFFWPLCCLFFFDLRILIIPLVSSKSSHAFHKPLDVLLSVSCPKPGYTSYNLFKKIEHIP